MDIVKLLFDRQDKEYAKLQAKIIPNIDPSSIIGVRTPELRKLAKELSKNEGINDFLCDLPHRYFDENQLHSFIISELKDYDECVSRVDEFLPCVDNWATCDQLSPKVFKKHRKELIKDIKRWMASDEVYTIRFGIGMLMAHFLDDDFNPEYPRMVSKIRSEEYYVNMMIAWYFATALAKQYDTVLPYIKDHKLDKWTNNKAIQKSVESYRITPEQKEYLRSLKIK